MEMLHPLIAIGKPLYPNFSIFEKISFLHSQQDLGRHIFPLRQVFFEGAEAVACDCGERGHCPGPGKHPAMLWGRPWDPFSDWSRKAVVNHATLAPSRGFGLHIGLSGLAILDIDARHNGIESIANLCKQHGVDIPEYTVRSSGGGGHIYYDAPIHAQSVRGFIGPNGESRCSMVIAPGVEAFFGAHFVVLPFSPHKSGCWYQSGPNQEMSPFPQWLLNLALSQDVFKAASISAPRPAGTPRVSHISGGDPSVNHARSYLQAVPGAIAGQSGSAATSRVASLLLIDFGLPYDDAYQLLSEWNASCAPPWTADELHRKLGWANGRPGERGWKNAPRARKQTQEDREVEELDGCTVRIQNVRYILNVTEGRIFTREYPPEVPVDHVSDVVASSSEIASPDVDIAKDDVPADVEPSCNCSFSLLMRHQIKNLFRLMRIPGRRWDCPKCGPARRRHLKETHEVRIRQWVESLPKGTPAVLYTFWVKPDERASITKKIRRRKGKFFRLDVYAMGTTGGGSFLIVSTVSIPGVQAVHTDAEDAISALNSIVNSWPTSLKIRVWWSSWSWKLLPNDEKRESHWKRIGRVKCSIAEQRKILTAWGVDLKHVGGSGTYYRWWADEGRFRPEDYEMIVDDLELGQFTGGKTWRDFNFSIPSTLNVTDETPVAMSG